MSGKVYFYRIKNFMNFLKICSPPTLRCVKGKMDKTKMEKIKGDGVAKEYSEST